MDAVHFAGLREGEQAAAVEMRGKVVGTREPEAFLDGEEFVLNRHGLLRVRSRDFPSQRVTEASVPGRPASWTRSALSSRARHQRVRPAARARWTARLVGSEM